MENVFFKYELVLEMRCMIHIYAETLEDITRLEEVIGLQNSCIAMQQAMEQRDQALIEQGKEEGNFEMALKFKEVLGLEETLLISGFSREELENEKLNRDNLSFWKDLNDELLF